MAISFFRMFNNFWDGFIDFFLDINLLFLTNGLFWYKRLLLNLVDALFEIMFLNIWKQIF